MMYCDWCENKITDEQHIKCEGGNFHCECFKEAAPEILFDLKMAEWFDTDSDGDDYDYGDFAYRSAAEEAVIRRNCG